MDSFHDVSAVVGAARHGTRRLPLAALLDGGDLVVEIAEGVARRLVRRAPRPCTA